MPDASDMSHPVTRAELREELAKHPTKAELALHLQGWADRLIDLFRAEMSAVRNDMRTLREELGAELARHVRAANEEMRDWTRAFDDRYKDLPPRVDKLETKVFAPKRRRR